MAANERYVVSDAHFHYLDFLQHTDGIARVIEVMDAARVKHSMISGMSLVKKWNASEELQPGYRAATFIVAVVSGCVSTKAWPWMAPPKAKRRVETANKMQPKAAAAIVLRVRLLVIGLLPFLFLSDPRSLLNVV